MRPKERTSHVRASGSGQLVGTGFELEPVTLGRDVGVRIQRVTARADGGRGPTGWDLPRRTKLTYRRTLP